jgi:hypothetical protein
MLVMSLVVLGIFSFRDLGVDLFPRADPATVNVTLSRPAPAPTIAIGHRADGAAISGVAGIDDPARISEARPTSRSGSCSSATSTKRSAMREKVAAAIKSVPPELLPPVDHESRPMLIR